MTLNPKPQRFRVWGSRFLAGSEDVAERKEASTNFDASSVWAWEPTGLWLAGNEGTETKM